MKYISTYFSPNRGGADVLIGFINRCNVSIDAAVYCITHDGICDALIAAHKRGVAVKVITDKIREAKIPLVLGGTAWRSSMHNKFVIGDSSAVGTGSFNWTKSADKRNNENFVIIRLSYVVREFQKEFDSLWSKLCKE